MLVVAVSFASTSPWLSAPVLARTPQKDRPAYRGGGQSRRAEGVLRLTRIDADRHALTSGSSLRSRVDSHLAVRGAVPAALILLAFEAVAEHAAAAPPRLAPEDATDPDPPIAVATR